MKKLLSKLFVILFIAVVTITSTFTVSAENEQGSSVSNSEIPYQSYTYWTDVNTSEKVAVYSKPMYTAEKFIRSLSFGGNERSVLNDIAAHKGYLYVLDGELSNIYVLNSKYEVYKIIEDVTYNNEKLDFSGARGIFVDNNGTIYIADTDHSRVIVTDINGKASELLLLPDSPLIPSGFTYNPVKIAVDANGYKYIASEGSYYGTILYSPEMEFLGFFGANTVKGTIVTALTTIYDRIFSNDTKRAADEVSLPYTIADITVGPDDFIYTATGRTSGDDIQYGQVCVYNPGGNESLGASSINFGDLEFGVVNKVKQKQNLSGIAVDNDGYMYLIDITYGRVFWYDQECNLLSVFGGSLQGGEQSGTSKIADAIEINGTDVIVTDKQKNGITVFKITEHGNLVKKANNITLSGDYAAALELWQEVLANDSNSQLAYRGIAKALNDMGKNKEAMEYAYIGYDRDTYGKAFKNVRNEWIESNFLLIFLGAGVIIAAIAVFVWHKKKKNIVLFKSDKSKTLISCTLHPVESFRMIKEKGTGSVIAAFVILIIFYVVTVLNDMLQGFIFTLFNSESYNAFYVFLSTVGLVILWTVSNWLVCTLLGGIGKIKEIFIVTCYCLIPIIIGDVLQLILTHILVEDEAAFMGIMAFAFILYAAFMLIVGMMRIHDFEFGRFIGTTLLTIGAMMVIIFLCFLLMMLTQQVSGWLVTVFSELKV